MAPIRLIMVLITFQYPLVDAAQRNETWSTMGAGSDLTGV